MTAHFTGMVQALQLKDDGVKLVICASDSPFSEVNHHVYVPDHTRIWTVRVLFQNTYTVRFA